jgi:virulence-associated protein VapD
LKNKDLAGLLEFDEKFSTDKRVDFNLNKPLVINSEFSSYLQSDGLLSNLANLVISLKHEFFDNPIRQAFADRRYVAALNQLNEAKSSSYLGSSYFESLPQTTEMTELFNLIESKDESLRSNRALSIKLMNKKLRAKRKKKRKKLLIKSKTPNRKNKFVFDFTEVDGSFTWNIVFKGKEVGRSIKKSKGYFLIRELLTNRDVPLSIESLDKMILSDYVPENTKEASFKKADTNPIASDKKYVTSHNKIAKIEILVSDLTKKLDDSSLTVEECENIHASLKKAYEKLTVLKENARIFKLQNDRVRKQIKDSLKTLNGFSTELWKHLDASIKKGNGGWVYDPENPIDWI